MRNANQASDYEQLKAAAHRVWTWVGPGYPDLDDIEERELFMADVSALARVYYYANRDA
jgi:hypothetical protein